ncbi:hypothetical protein JXB01_00335 [Candidatus Micrarchaeota archaeon]|nr:hypothetical protein [Candidatus Micrarchaeota archaeon]
MTIQKKKEKVVPIQRGTLYGLIKKQGLSSEAESIMLNSLEELIKNGITDPQVIALLSRKVNKYLNSDLKRTIGKISIPQLGFILDKRGEEFLDIYMKTMNGVGNINFLLSAVIGNVNTVDNIVLFSPEGITEWIKDGMEKFNPGENNLEGTVEFSRWILMVKPYDDTSDYRIKERAVFLDDIKGSLTVFIRSNLGLILTVKKTMKGAYTKETDELGVYLPEYFDKHQTKDTNKTAYYLLASHEGMHIWGGSFKLTLNTICKILSGKGIKVVDLELKRNGRIKEITCIKNGKKLKIKSQTALIEQISDYPGLLHDLWNINEDMKIDGWFIDEKAYAWGGESRRIVHNYINEEYISKCSGEGAKAINDTILLVTSFIALSENKQKLADAFITGNTKGLGESEKEAVEKYKKINNENAKKIIKKYIQEIIKVSNNRKHYTDETILLSERMTEDVKKFITKQEFAESQGKGFGTKGPNSIEDLDLENIEIEIGDSDEDGIPVNMEDIPPELMEKIKEKINEGKETKNEGDKPNEGEINWVFPEYRGEILVEGYSSVKEKQGTEVPPKIDKNGVNKLEAVLRMITTSKTRIITGGLAGHADPREKRRWKQDKKIGIRRPRDYHEITEITDVRSVAVLLSGDMSGSTNMRLDGKRKIDYIAEGVNTVGTAITKIPSIKFGAYFYSSSGPANTIAIWAKKFDEPNMRYVNIKPTAANRDGVQMRFGGKILEGQKAQTKIFIWTCDSMPADNDYNGKQAVDDTRRARLDLEAKGIKTLAVTVPPDKGFYNECGFSDVSEYLDYLHGPGNWRMIKSEQEYCDALAELIKIHLSRLRRRGYR